MSASAEQREREREPAKLCANCRDPEYDVVDRSRDAVTTSVPQS